MNFLSLLTSWHILEMVVLLAFWLAPAAHAQRASQASTFIQNGNLAISKPGGSVFHPGHTMVRFRRGAAPDFLPTDEGLARRCAAAGFSESLDGSTKK